jgi:hypothetical protein
MRSRTIFEDGNDLLPTADSRDRPRDRGTTMAVVEAITALLGLKVVDKIYSDVASPSLKQVGGLAEATVKTVLIAGVPIYIGAAYFDRLMKQINEAIREIPEDKRQPAHPSIAAPIIEQLRYHEEGESLSDMYMSLLKRALHKDTSHLAHPAYPKLIGQLAPDEALILHMLGERNFFEHTYADVDFTSRSVGIATPTYQEFPTNRLTYPENFYFYSDHLASLGLSVFTIVENQGVYDSKFTQIQTGTIRRASLQLTNVGRQFVQACDPEFKLENE